MCVFKSESSFFTLNKNSMYYEVLPTVFVSFSHITGLPGRFCISGCMQLVGRKLNISLPHWSVDYNIESCLVCKTVGFFLKISLVYRVFIRHHRSENSPLTMQNSLANISYSITIFDSDMEPLSK